MPPDLDASYTPDFFSADEAAGLFTQLRDGLAWQQQAITIYGRTVMQPRLLAWYGDAGAVYTYSGKRNEPLPWVPVLTTIRQQAEAATGARFNSVLANYYRDGQDSMGWHSDDEPELGPEPVIASFSFGAARDFRFRRRTDRVVVPLSLAPGSLLVMFGNNQRHWQHALPKRAVAGPRINLTFRYVTPAGVMPAGNAWE